YVDEFTNDGKKNDQLVQGFLSGLDEYYGFSDMSAGEIIFWVVVIGTTHAYAYSEAQLAKAAEAADFQIRNELYAKLEPDIDLNYTGGVSAPENIGAIGKGGSGLGNKRIYRVMSEAELDAVKDTGMLRGGREGTTFFTDSYYKNASTAKSRLSLPEKPKYIMEFEIENNPKILGGTRVEPNFGELGGGREYFTNDLVKVKIINYQKMIGGN
ncbi:MAG: hypothetical protein IJ141_11090, partial [Lachnospiraceae bacterium]|nr:hypothetical protein [Lachnospiraceae bacterium]